MEQDNFRTLSFSKSYPVNPVNPVEQSLSLLEGFSYLVSPQRRKGRRENQGFATAWGLRFRFAKAYHERKRIAL